MKGECLLQILSLKRGANSKRGAYLKLGTNSSIYSILLHVFIYFMGTNASASGAEQIPETNNSNN